jgi:hypothetical protein
MYTAKQSKITERDKIFFAASKATNIGYVL